jgi:zinc transport system substrate-binding protein
MIYSSDLHWNSLLEKTYMKRATVVGLFLLCSMSTQLVCAEPVKVFVSILPQKYFVEKLGGDLVDVSVMVAPGASPATYEPKPRQMVALARARIYFGIGVPFEKNWLEKIGATNPRMLVVHTENGIEKMVMKQEHRHSREGLEGPEAERETHHGIRDPHVWLSPPLVMLQARNILNALLTVDPVHRAVYEQNYKSFIVEIVSLDEEIRTVFAGRGEDLEFMVFHPAWGYFARAYGLEQVAIELEGKEPKPAELERLVHDAREKKVKVVFVQPQFSQQTARTIARAIGGQVAVADPLAPDWCNNLRAVAARFKAALK